VPSKSMKTIRPVKIACAVIFIVTFLISNYEISRAGAAPKAEKKGEDTLTINSKNAAYSLENEQFVIKGEVSLKTSTLRVEGRDLKFNNKTRVGSLEGDPVKMFYESRTQATAGRVDVDMEKETAKVSGGVSVQHSTGTVDVKIRCDSANLDMKTGWTDARGGVTIDYSDKKSEAAYKKAKAEAEKKAAEKAASGDSATTAEEDISIVATSPVHITADYVNYNYKTGEMSIGKALRAETPDVKLTAKEMSGSLADSIINVKKGVDLKVKNITATAARGTVDYGKEKAVLEGKVKATRGDDVFTGEKVEINYKDGQRSIYVYGPVEIQFTIKREEPKEK
jgi:lipopolysaccharide export system protein LptA